MQVNDSSFQKYKVCGYSLGFRWGGALNALVYMELWRVTFTSFSVLKTPCLVLFYLIILAHLAADSLTFIGSRYIDEFNLKQLSIITYKILSTDQPPYLSSLLHPYRPLGSLRSANRNLLLIPPHTTNFSRRAFSFTSPHCGTINYLIVSGSPTLYIHSSIA